VKNYVNGGDILGKIISLLLVMLFMVNVGVVHASDRKEPDVLIITSDENAKDPAGSRILNILVGHFTEHITTIKDTELEKVDTQNYTHILYMGLHEKQLSKELIKKLTEFAGPVFLIWKNSEQLQKRFDFFEIEGEILVHAAHLESNGAEQKFEAKLLAEKVQLRKGAETLVSGTDLNGMDQPIIIKKGNSYYYALDSLFNPNDYFLSEALFDFFDAEPSEKHQKYLRLEDIHPKADADQLMEIAKFLNEKKIPYMIALIPVYIDPNTKKEMHLKDAPKLVKTLKYMQDHGGSVILHGYRHQYRHMETGEGFEFWDVDRDRPILQSRDELPQTRKDFSSDQAYEAFIKKGKQFEDKYVKEAIRNGLQETTAHKLYPLAFEAPHYAMSEEGYQILSQYFSTYVGQVQLSNDTWKQGYAPLYTSTPSFFNGMRLIPETVGYVMSDDPQSIPNMEEKGNNLIPFSDSMVGGFYHPYLGIKRLKELVASFERIPNTEWLDLKELDNKVSIDDIHIESSQGKVKVDKNIVSSDYEEKRVISASIPWVIAVIFLISLILIWFSHRHEKRKRVGRR